MNKEEAIALAETKWWEGKTDEEIAEFQIHEELFCCPFDIFHKAIETWLGRPVFTHEFAAPDALIAEKEGKTKSPQSPLESLLRVAPHLAGRVIIVKPDDLERDGFIDKLAKDIENKMQENK